MKRAAIVLTLLCASCGTEMWIPVVQTAPRQAVPVNHVAYLQELPDKPYDVIGIVTPPIGEYETEAAAVSAIRKEAARHGADAIFVETASAEGGWKFSVNAFGGGGAGGGKDAVYRAKAIVWK